jgi:hypothetical protein
MESVIVVCDVLTTTMTRARAGRAVSRVAIPVTVEDIRNVFALGEDRFGE